MRHGLAFLAILALVGAALWFDFSPRVPVREGLDLKGGMRVTLEADQAQIREKRLNVTVDTETMGRVREILENRVNAFGLSGTTVQVKGDRFAARARDARPEEKPALWRTMTEIWPAYDDYQRRTEREIPLVVLERV